MRYGYARVSTTDQDLTIQIEELRRAGCEVVRAEKVSGRSVDGRDELALLRSFLRAGDELWVSRLDRLARSVHDLAVMVREFRQRGVALRSIHENVDTATPSGEAFCYMAGIFGQLDYDVRRERQVAGIARKRAAGEYAGRGGRPRADVDPAAAARLRGEVGASAAARALGVSRATLYRVVAAEATV